MYPAEVLILNTVEMGLETSAPLRQHYQVKLLENLSFLPWWQPAGWRL